MGILNAKGRVYSRIASEGFSGSCNLCQMDICNLDHFKFKQISWARSIPMFYVSEFSISIPMNNGKKKYTDLVYKISFIHHIYCNEFKVCALSALQNGPVLTIQSYLDFDKLFLVTYRGSLAPKHILEITLQRYKFLGIELGFIVAATIFQRYRH